MFVISTARLMLRDFVEGDWQAIDALSQAPAVTRYQSWLRLAEPIEAQSMSSLILNPHKPPYGAIQQFDSLGMMEMLYTPIITAL